MGIYWSFFLWTIDVMNYINRFLNIELLFVPEINHSWYCCILLKILFWIWFARFLSRIFASIFMHKIGQQFTFWEIFIFFALMEFKADRSLCFLEIYYWLVKPSRSGIFLINISFSQFLLVCWFLSKFWSHILYKIIHFVELFKIIRVIYNIILSFKLSALDKWTPTLIPGAVCSHFLFIC